MSGDDKLKRIEDKIDRLDGRLDGVDVRLAVYNEQLKVHIEGVQLARAENAVVAKRLRPLEARHTLVSNLAKGLTAAGGLILFAKQLGLF